MSDEIVAIEELGETSVLEVWDNAEGSDIAHLTNDRGDVLISGEWVPEKLLCGREPGERLDYLVSQFILNSMDRLRACKTCMKAFHARVARGEAI